MPYYPSREEWQAILEERRRDLEEWNRWTFKNRQQNSSSTEESYQSSNEMSKTKQKLMESEGKPTNKSRKELKEMSKPYHIGSLLPEAKTSWLKLYGPVGNVDTSAQSASKTSNRESSGEVYHIGSLLLEARSAFAKLYLS